MASAFLRAGVPVLVEKPVCRTVAEADELVALAAKAGVPLQVGHIERFNPAFEELSRRPIQPKFDAKGYFVTTAIGPDLMEDSKNAVRDMIAWLGREKDLSREDAYILCSEAGDLRISQIVDAGNWCVSFYLALSVFR